MMAAFARSAVVRLDTGPGTLHRRTLVPPAWPHRAAYASQPHSCGRERAAPGVVSYQWCRQDPICC